MFRPRRVVFFTETYLPRVDGIVNTLTWALKGLVRAGWEPLVIAPSGNTGGLPGVRVIGAPSVTFPLYPEVRLAYPTPEVWRALDAFGPDLVHLAGPVTNGYGGLKYAQSRGVPVLSTYHTALPEYARLYGLTPLVDWIWSLLRDVHNSTAATLCPSTPTIHDLRSRGFANLTLWSRGVDTRQFTPTARSTAVRHALGAHDDELLVLSVGRLAREKKLERLAAAARRVPGIHVAVVGDGPDKALIEKVFDGASVTFTGTLRGADLAAAYASADVFAFPSDTETFGNVVLEAMASGLPVIATTRGGQTDLVAHDANGFLFEPDDTQALASYLEAYRDDPLVRARHGARGYALALDRTWSKQTDLLIEHYARLSGAPAYSELAGAVSAA